MIVTSREELIAAFQAWHKGFEENPEEFGGSPDDAEASAYYLISLLPNDITDVQGPL